LVETVRLGADKPSERLAMWGHRLGGHIHRASRKKTIRNGRGSRARAFDMIFAENPDGAPPIGISH